MSYPIDKNQYRSLSCNSRIRFLILHYTACNFATSIKKLTTDVSVHYLIPDPMETAYLDVHQELKIFNLVAETDRAWHAGISSWENSHNLNDQSLGIEIVNESDGVQFLPFHDGQIDAVIQLCVGILARYPDIRPTRVLAHSDITLRKDDPGPLFPWPKLYAKGIGAWYDGDVYEHYYSLYQKKGLPDDKAIKNQLIIYGYTVSHAADLEKVIRAFQIHFRPSLYDGHIDLETAAILAALVEKYFSS